MVAIVECPYNYTNTAKDGITKEKLAGKLTEFYHMDKKLGIDKPNPTYGI
jgi:hypothetical protein